MQRSKEYCNPVCEGADPFVLLHDGKYYLYATNVEDGFRVFESDDLTQWEDRGYCLKNEDVMGEFGFWAPEVMFHNGKFYMVYVAEEHLGVAIADSPLGPFRQEKKQWISPRQAIDGHFFVDDDGTVYLYYVRFDGGNVLYACPMAENLLTIREQEERFLLRAELEWETKDCEVAEGPFVLKHNGKYYLTYSANHFRSPFYAIGYAVADRPLGPFVKYAGNPVLKKSDAVNGVGHHSFTYSKDGSRLICVYHCHNSLTKIHLRMTCIDPAEFVPSEKGGDDILVIHGPTATPQAAIAE